MYAFASDKGENMATQGAEQFKKADEHVLKCKNEFEADSIIGLDFSKITFICELCGFVNGIDCPRCKSCGKPRPRGEYISAMKKLRLSLHVKKDPLLYQPVIVSQIEERNELMEIAKRREEAEQAAKEAYEKEFANAKSSAYNRETKILDKLVDDTVPYHQAQAHQVSQNEQNQDFGPPQYYEHQPYTHAPTGYPSSYQTHNRVINIQTES